jgi:hypothetical protein
MSSPVLRGPGAEEQQNPEQYDENIPFTRRQFSPGFFDR